MAFKKLIFTQIFISAILASPAPQVGGFDFGGMLGGGGGLSKPNRGHRGGFDQEATTGLLNGGIGAANGLVKLGTAEETIVEERVVEVPAPQESRPVEHENVHEFEPESEPEFVDTRISHSHVLPEDELFFAHHRHIPEELLLEEEALLLHEEPAEHIHKEIDIEEKPSNPIIVESKPENFSFNSFMPDFAKSFFQDESA